VTCSLLSKQDTVTIIYAFVQLDAWCEVLNTKDTLGSFLFSSVIAKAEITSNIPVHPSAVQA
jgi:hypothetical protein